MTIVLILKPQVESATSSDENEEDEDEEEGKKKLSKRHCRQKDPEME